MELGVLEQNTHLAHCVWVEQEDFKILGQTRTSIAHCPHANLKLGSGVAPIPSMISSGIKVTLATDGAKANNRIDMFDVMKFAGLIHRGFHHNPSILPPEQVFGMATSNGAEVLGYRSGRLAQGYNADIAFINIDQIHLQPAQPQTIIPNLVYSAQGSDVDQVMVGGRILVQEGKLVSGKHDQIIEKMKLSARRLMNMN